MGNKRNLKGPVETKDIIIAVLVVSFMITTAIISFCFDQYEFFNFISSKEKLFRFWVVVFFILLILAGIEKLISRGRGSGPNNQQN